MSAKEIIFKEIIFKNSEATIIKASKRRVHKLKKKYDRETRRLLRKAGWQKVNVTIIMKRFDGSLMTNFEMSQLRKVRVDLTNSRYFEIDSQADIHNGMIHLQNVWAIPAIPIRISLISLMSHHKHIYPINIAEGLMFYDLNKKIRNTLRFTVTQGSDYKIVQKLTKEEASFFENQTSSTGLDLKIISLGGEESKGHTTSRGGSISESWKISFPTKNLNIVQY